MGSMLRNLGVDEGVLLTRPLCVELLIENLQAYDVDFDCCDGEQVSTWMRQP